jgi:hypothetical protein
MQALIVGLENRALSVSKHELATKHIEHYKVACTKCSGMLVSSQAMEKTQ